MIIKPKGGANFRLPANETPKNQYLFMQNIDMKHSELFEQIDGSIFYHNNSLGTAPASGIFIYYNNDLNIAKVLVAVDDKIYLKNQGSGAFTQLISGLTPGKAKFAVNVGNTMFIAHPEGLLQYDGISTISFVPNGPKCSDIIFAKEVNRCFAIDATIPNGYLWTDDLTTMGGVPLVWAGLNADTVAQTDGDVLEKLGFLNGRLVAFMTNSTWIEYVNGAPSNWRWEKASTTVGWIAPTSIKQVGAEYWGFGFSPFTGRGVYSFNGVTTKLLSLDAEPILNRINETKLEQVCAEFVNNIYKLSFALDSSINNDTTLHFDYINQNPETGVPNFYGPHTYGFSASTVLNTRKFFGQHLFANAWNSLISQYGNGSWVFEVGPYLTQHASGPVDDGDLIKPLAVTGILCKDELGKAVYDETWMKRYQKFITAYPPYGAWAARVEVLVGFSNEAYTSFNQFLDAEKSSVSAINLGTDPVDDFAYQVKPNTLNVLGQGIQLKISNTNVRTKTGFSYLSYDCRPVRRIKDAQKIYIN